MPIDLELLKQLETEWKSLQPLQAQREERLWQKLRLEWNFHSNHLEGNTLTYGETAAYLLHDQTSGNHTAREYGEMKGHDLAIELVSKLAVIPQNLTEADIRNLNQIILKEPFYKEAITLAGEPTRKLITPGRYKEEPNSVRTSTGALFEYAMPVDVPIRMTKLIETIQGCARKNGLEFIATLAITHHEFTLIHPFDDGNGRVARLITNYVLLKKGLPPLVIPSDQKKDYLNALRLADGGDLTTLTDFFAGKLLWSLELGIKAAKGESLEEPSDIDKEIALFVREQERNQEHPQKKNKKDIERLWEKSFKPLLIKLEEKTREISKLFSNRLVILSIDHMGSFPLEEGIAKVALCLDTNATLPERIEVSLKLDGYRGLAPNPFTIQDWLTIRLDEYAYTVNWHPVVRFTSAYSKNLSILEIDEMVNNILKDLFLEIKKQTQ